MGPILGSLPILGILNELRLFSVKSEIKQVRQNSSFVEGKTNLIRAIFSLAK